MFFVEPDSPDWNRMWTIVQKLTGDIADYNPESGEVWQYMGSYRRSSNGRAYHQFRHRHRPTNAKPIPQYFRFPEMVHPQPIPRYREGQRVYMEFPLDVTAISLSQPS